VASNRGNRSYWYAEYSQFYQKNGHYIISTISSLVKVKVKLSLCLTKHHAMKMYWGSGEEWTLHNFHHVQSSVDK
jgi:hypothetical protein